MLFLSLHILQDNVLLLYESSADLDNGNMCSTSILLSNTSFKDICCELQYGQYPFISSYNITFNINLFEISYPFSSIIFAALFLSVSCIFCSFLICAFLSLPFTSFSDSIDIHVGKAFFSFIIALITFIDCLNVFFT